MKIFGAGVEKQVHVDVDESGQQRGIAQVHDLRISRVGYCRTDRGNSLALDQNLSGRYHAARIDLQKPRGMQHDGMTGDL